MTSINDDSLTPQSPRSQRIAKRKQKKEDRRKNKEEKRKNASISRGISWILAHDQFEIVAMSLRQEPSLSTLVNGYSSLLELLSQDKEGYSRGVWVDYYPFPKKKDLTNWALWALSQPNAGGCSEISEALSVDYFARLGGKDFISEMDVSYLFLSSMVDYLLSLPGQDSLVGASVTRAMGYPHAEDFDWRDALILLNKKIYGLIVAGKSVNEKHNFSRSILHIWCQTPRIAAILRQVYQSFDIWDFGLDVSENLILVLTVCPAPQIYQNTAWD